MKNKNTGTASSLSHSIPTFNRYADLSDNANESTIVPPTKPNRPKIPPIVVEKMTFNTIKETMNQIGIPTTAYYTKYISIGIKILISDIENYKKAIKALTESKQIGFTHDIPSEKTVKFVLSGLPEFPIDYVKQGLEENDLKFVDIKLMNLKLKRYEQQASYIVYFENKSIRLSDLSKIESVHNVMVTWHPYVSARNGPTQCNNCQLYGHGARNCFSPPRCMNCGGKHKTEECLKDMDPIQNFEPKCCLCAGSHTSNDRNCPKRLEYINLRVKAATKTSKQTARRNFAPENNLNFSNKFYPPLRPVKPNQPFSRWFQPNQPAEQSQQSSRPHQSFELPSMTQSTNTQQQSFLPSQAPRPAQYSTQEHRNNVPNDCLFSAEELIGISKDLIIALRSCRSKMDQFDAILSVALKFGVYNV